MAAPLTIWTENIYIIRAIVGTAIAVSHTSSETRDAKTCTRGGKGGSHRRASRMGMDAFEIFFHQIGGHILGESQGWGLVGPTGGSDRGEGREPLLPGTVGPEGRKRLAWKPRVTKAGCHPFIILGH